MQLLAVYFVLCCDRGQCNDIVYSLTQRIELLCLTGRQWVNGSRAKSQISQSTKLHQSHGAWAKKWRPSEFLVITACPQLAISVTDYYYSYFHCINGDGIFVTLLLLMQNKYIFYILVWWGSGINHTRIGHRSVVKWVTGCQLTHCLLLCFMYKICADKQSNTGHLIIYIFWYFRHFLFL